MEGAAGAGASTSVIDISRLRIGQCKDCGDCYSHGACWQDDDLAYVMDCLLKSDGIVLGSPAYASVVTPEMSVLAERMGEARHCLLLDGKYGFAVSVSRDGGESLAISQMNGFLMSCGVSIIGGAGASLQRRGSLDRGLGHARKLGEDLAAAIRDRRRYEDQEETRMAFIREFGAHVRANRERWAHDHAYWVKKGWIQ
jgi:multimeric flavodoxin WrbA